MEKPWTYQKDEITGRYFVTSNKTPPFGMDICYGIKEEKTAALISAAPELLAALIEMCQIERDQDPESRNIHDAQRRQYEAIIRRAGGKV